ncbi:branched-chain amino acid transport system II carrier protein [Legionella spiritensis]|uniref:branched-chain amino acid transport system II carrier protein n=1 Tax=Legionella spiritensis TaxID=452 RepID=UPI000F7170EC|nr:branched-chain amino acid transport system II carrier protein [Legionella spiritensis]VEG91528.1 LIV-II [Legionella spiritensis]
MQQQKSIFIYGFAIFAMFFGSGNLVFPLQIGYASGTGWIYGFIGLLLTGICLPLMGLFVIKLHQGNYRSFFNEAGSFAGVFLPLVLLSLLGSFGVVPRCITVAYGSVSYLLPQIPLGLFSLLFCIVTFFCCINDRIMINVLGKWMSPILLLILMVLIGMAIFKAPVTTTGIKPYASLSNGFFSGYQTMDLFAAFFFSALIFNQIQQQLQNASHKDVIRYALKPSLLGAGLLALVYYGFVFLGAHYAPMLQGVKPELMLPAIAVNTFGNQATLLMGLAMLFSCLTTAVALNNLFARYLQSSLNMSERQFYLILAGTTGISFIISLLDFKGIGAFLAPILQITYPGIIALTIMGLIMRKHRRLKMAVFYLITLFVAIASLAMTSTSG